MKVIFLKDVPETADAGEVKEVKNGFARNYLLPNGLAAPATPDQLQRVRAIEKAAHETRLKFSEEWEVVAEAIAGTTVEVEVRVGPSGRLFGSVTGRAIAEKLTEATGRQIDHRQVLLGAAIHEPGDYPVQIRLYRDVQAEVTVSVVAEGLSPEEAAAMAAMAEEDLPESLDDAAASDESPEASAEDDQPADEPARESDAASTEADEASADEEDEKKDEDA